MSRARRVTFDGGVQKPTCAIESRPAPMADLSPEEHEAIARAESVTIQAGEQRSDDNDSSPEFVTNDELFGYNDDAEEKLVDAALREHGLDNVGSVPYRRISGRC